MCLEMATCRLCGYRVRLNSEKWKQQCPICGEAFVVLRDDGPNKMAAGLPVAASGDFAWSGASAQQQSQSNIDTVHQRDGTKRPPSNHLKPELLGLLQMVPGSHDRRIRAQDAVRAAVGLTLPLPKDSNASEHDPVVYIRPRADPTMRVLKVRYNTQPRTARAVSTSALHRLADPLTGYDSMEALAPQIRRRRQESIERLMGRRIKREKRDNMCGQEKRLSNSTGGSDRVPSLLPAAQRSGSHATLIPCTVPPPRPGGRAAPSRRSLYLNSFASAANPPPRARSNCTTYRRHWSSSDATGLIMERRYDQQRQPLGKSESASNGKVAMSSFRLGEARGRRAKPNLRRKRVATMRSVNGWVREADPASAWRQLSLERRKIALKNTRDEKTKCGGRADDQGRNLRETSASVGGNSIFLTELDADDACSSRREYGWTGSGSSSTGWASRGTSGQCGRGNVKDATCRKNRAKGGTVFVGKKTASRPRGRSWSRNQSSPFVKAGTYGLRDCGGGAVRANEGDIEDGGGDLNRSCQRSLARTAVGPSGQNATRLLGKKLAGGHLNKLPREDRRRASMYCTAGDGVDEPLSALGSNEVEAESNERKKIHVASSRLPGHNSFAVVEPVPEKSNVPEETTRSMAQRCMVPASRSSNPRLATCQNPGSVMKPHHLQSTGQSFRDIEGDVFVSTRSLALDSKGQKAVGIPAQDHSSPGAASALAGDRPTEFFLKVNGRSCRRSVGDVPPPPRLKPWSTAVLQESGSNYWQPCQSLPTLLAVQNNSEPSKWSAQKAVRLDGAISWRGRRRSSSRESTGVMQKLNLSPIKIGNTLGTNFAGNYCCGGISKQQKPGRLSLGSTVAVWGTKSRKGLEQRVPATRRIRITSSDSSRNGSFLRLGSRGLAARRQ